MERKKFECARVGKSVTVSWQTDETRGGKGEADGRRNYGMRCTDDVTCGNNFNWDDCEYIKQHGRP